jgi:hypothetical protein
MIRYLLSLLDFAPPMFPRLSFPHGFVPAPMVRQGRVSGVRAAKRLSRKRHNCRRARHV